MTARGFGRGPLWLTIPIGIVFAFLVWLIFARRPAAVAARRPARAPLLLTEAAHGHLRPARPGPRSPRCSRSNLLYALIGVTLGTAVGVLPGIGPALTVALLLPVTYQLDPTGSLIMFAGIYYGGMYGGSTTSILLNTPGESASIVTALEGNKMARAGRGGPALATAAIGSFVAGLIATLGLAFVAPWVVKFALSLGPAEYFALMVLAFVTVSAAFGDSALRGLTALFLGLALGLVGIDLQTGQARLTFGIPDLLDGIEVTTLAVALFAVGEALKVAATPVARRGEGRGGQGLGLDDARGLGALVEALAARHRHRLPDRRHAGRRRRNRRPSSPTRPKRRCAKHPEEFGHGAIEGVAGPEAANNASAAGTLVPLLTLGLPTTRDGGDHARGLPAVRPAAGAAAVRQQPAAGLGADRQPAGRQLHAAGAEPAADRPVGAAADHSAALALRRHPAVRDAGHHRRQSLGRSNSGCCSPSACSAMCCAASTTRSRRWWSG